jgi:hypothetical protein
MKITLTIAIAIFKFSIAISIGVVCGFRHSQKRKTKKPPTIIIEIK